MRLTKRSMAWLERRNYSPALRKHITQQVSRKRDLGDGAAPAVVALASDRLGYSPWVATVRTGADSVPREAENDDRP